MYNWNSSHKQHQSEHDHEPKPDQVNLNVEPGGAEQEGTQQEAAAQAEAEAEAEFMPMSVVPDSFQRVAKDGKGWQNAEPATGLIWMTQEQRTAAQDLVARPTAAAAFDSEFNEAPQLRVPPAAISVAPDPCPSVAKNGVAAAGWQDVVEAAMSVVPDSLQQVAVDGVTTAGWQNAEAATGLVRATQEHLQRTAAPEQDLAASPAAAAAFDYEYEEAPLRRWVPDATSASRYSRPRVAEGGAAGVAPQCRVVPAAMQVQQRKGYTLGRGALRCTLAELSYTAAPVARKPVPLVRHAVAAKWKPLSTGHIRRLLSRKSVVAGGPASRITQD